MPIPSLILALAISTAHGDNHASTVTQTPPNIVLIFADDMGYGDLGCYGGKNLTPNLDRLALEGMRFTDFYVAQAVCSASRAALLTGCYPNRIGINGALGPASMNAIHPDEQTMAELLKSQGYATAIYGKWHLGHREPSLPAHHGFDDYFGLPYSNDMGPQHPTPRAFPDLPLIDGTAVITKNPDQRKLTGWSTQKSVNFIKANRERPFFLYVPYSMPHVPLHVSEAYERGTGRGLYADVLAEVDASVGSILKAIDDESLREQTIVIFMSDNGPWLTYGDHAGTTGGLREGKGTTFEGGVKVPCLVRWPSVVAPGSVCREPAMTIDWLPTLARAAGMESMPNVDGRDLTPLLHSDPGASRSDPLLFYWNGELQAVRSGRWKLHFAHDHVTLAGPPGSGGRPGKTRTGHTEDALYDLVDDPAETRDRAAENPVVVAELKEMAKSARLDLGDTATGHAGAHVRKPAIFESK